MNLSQASIIAGNIGLFSDRWTYTNCSFVRRFQNGEKKKALQASKKLSNVYDEKKPSNYDGVRIDLLNLTADEYIKSFLELS